MLQAFKESYLKQSKQSKSNKGNNLHLIQTKVTKKMIPIKVLLKFQINSLSGYRNIAPQNPTTVKLCNI